MPLDGFSSWLTPVERFFVRSHHYTPEVKLDDWKLQIGGEVERSVTLTMADLKKLPRVELVSVLECAGNGRALYDPPVPGVQWVYGSVGNARWTGVRLSDVLAKAGVKTAAKNLLFDGADVPMGTMPEFKRTLPLRKAMARDTLLAYEMNGQTMPVSHGFPLRLIVPGWAGDSWVKWVTSITALDKDYDGFFMKTAYRRPDRAVTPGAAVDPAAMHPVEEINVKSIITSPVEDASIGTGALRIQGVAWAGEKPVAYVEVSTDRGRTWQKAQLGKDQAQYGWRQFQHTWTPPGTGHYILMARAFDTAGKTQPMTEEWNPSGYLNNVVQQVAVEVTTDPRPAGQKTTPGSDPALAKKFETPKSFHTACQPCHEEDIVMQQRLTRTQWEREIDKMVRWGAKVNPAERSELLDYLLKLYGPRPRK